MDERTVKSLCQLPAGDCNYSSALSRAEFGDLTTAIRRMIKGKQNRSRIDACKRKIKSFLPKESRFDKIAEELSIVLKKNIPAISNNIEHYFKMIGKEFWVRFLYNLYEKYNYLSYEDFSNAVSLIICNVELEKIPELEYMILISYIYQVDNKYLMTTDELKDFRKFKKAVMFKEFLDTHFSRYKSSLTTEEFLDKFSVSYFDVSESENLLNSFELNSSNLLMIKKNKNETSIYINPFNTFEEKKIM